MSDRVLPDNIRELVDRQFEADERRHLMRARLDEVALQFLVDGASEVEVAEAFEATAQAARLRFEAARLAERKSKARRK